MHILVTNDDGPPSAQASPYILQFVKTLEAAGHTVSVILPDQQRSWIGKSHIVGKDVKTVFYWPPEQNPDVHPESASYSDNGKYPWVLVNSTPAACSQLGLDCFFTDRGPIVRFSTNPFYYVY
jgi:5'/3'-nucleotidase SurE